MATFALIPGAGGRSSYWRLVAPLLGAAGHDVVAPDLPAADPGAGIAEYAEVVEAALREARVAQEAGDADLVVVGQSMGAFTAPVVAAHHPGCRLVLLAPMIPVPGETPGQWFGGLGLEAARVAAAEAGGYPPGFDPVETFFHDVDPAVVAEVLAEGEPEQSEAVFASPCPISAWPDARTEVIAGRHDRMFPLPFVRRLARERLGLDVVEIASGHLPALARPEQLARLLLTASQG